MTVTHASKESIHIWRSPALSGVDLLRASYRSQRFGRHSHDHFAIGMIEDGALGFRYRGADVVAPAGAVNLANAGEVHTGQAAAPQGWSYRMFYMETRVLRAVATQLSGRRRDVPRFQPGVIHDRQLAGTIRRLHQNLEIGADGALAFQTGFLEMLALLVERHADPPVAPGKAAQAPKAVQRVKAMMADDPQARLSIDDLAATAGLSPYHFIRVFRQTVGLTPHAYLVQLRVETAKRLLGRGQSVVAAALAAGFADQSHLTRHFRRLLGITPGQYRNFVQDRLPRSVYIPQ